MVLIWGLNVGYRAIVWVTTTLSVIAILRFGVLPIVRVIVGTETSFDFSFVVNISLVLNGALGIGLVVSEAGRRRANRELRESPPP